MGIQPAMKNFLACFAIYDSACSVCGTVGSIRSDSDESYSFQAMNA